MKAPAFQFYVKDWLSDPQLRLASASTRGIWIDLLCYMWSAPCRGKLNGTVHKMCQLGGCTEDEMNLFINEANFLKFADVIICNNELTVCNRRMVREEKDREGNRLRVEKHRMKHESNKDVMPPSPSPSPSPVTKVTSNESKVSFENGSFKNLTSEVLGAWKKAYPAIDVHAEIRKAEAWVVSNPHNKKSQWMRFLNSWFSRAQDKAPPKRDSIIIPQAQPKHRCQKCEEKVHEVVEHRGQKVCENCLRILAPEIPDKMKAILNSMIK